jgi:large subunit ribosomal protein L13
MNTLSYKTISANVNTVHKNWVIIDAEGATLGRLASKAAFLIRGKHKVDYTPHVDCGDNVIIINAEKIVLKGKKMTDKQYVRHTGYPGGQRTATPIEVMAKKPTAVVEMAIRGMLPKSKLGRAIFGNLFIYAGAEHPHGAQKPQLLNLNDLK